VLLSYLKHKMLLGRALFYLTSQLGTLSCMALVTYSSGTTKELIPTNHRFKVLSLYSKFLIILRAHEVYMNFVRPQWSQFIVSTVVPNEGVAWVLPHSHDREVGLCTF